MNQFSEQVAEILLKGGWHLGRRVPTDRFVDALKKEGFPIFESVVKFLGEFGGIRCTNDKLPSPAVSDVHFDAVEASSGQAPYVEENYSRVIKRELCVIGEADNNYLLLLIDKSGCFFAGCEEELSYLGNNQFIAIEALFDDSELDKATDKIFFP